MGALSVPDMIRQILELAELNQTEFARKIQVRQGTISKWMNDKEQPNKRAWDRVERFAAQHEKTKHLVPGSVLVDDLLIDQPRDIQVGARNIIEAYVKTHGKPGRGR